MEKLVLSAEARNETGKGPNRRLRSEGRIPAVLYGGSDEPVSLSLPGHELQMLMKKTHAMLTLAVAGREMQVMLGEIQRDPLSNAMVHVDLMRIEAGHEVHAHVEVVGACNPIGVREGGILERPVREVEIRCMPADLPERLEVDVSELKIGDSLKAGDLKLGDNVHLVTDPDTLMFHVVIPKAAAEPVPGEGAEETQPELVAKKKEADAEAEK